MFRYNKTGISSKGVFVENISSPSIKTGKKDLWASPLITPWGFNSGIQLNCVYSGTLSFGFLSFLFFHMF